MFLATPCDTHLQCQAGSVFLAININNEKKCESLELPPSNEGQLHGRQRHEVQKIIKFRGPRLALFPQILDRKDW